VDVESFDDIAVEFRRPGATRLGFCKGTDDPNYGRLRLDPWRIELWSLQGLSAEHHRKSGDPATNSRGLS
jgi:hypothetical protein